MKPKPIASLKEFYQLTSKRTIQVGILLNSFLRSTHDFSRNGNKIFDYSHVDDSNTEYTKKEFEETIYAEAIRKKAMILEQVNL